MEIQNSYVGINATGKFGAWPLPAAAKNHLAHVAGKYDGILADSATFFGKGSPSYLTVEKTLVTSFQAMVTELGNIGSKGGVN